MGVVVGCLESTLEVYLAKVRNMHGFVLLRLIYFSHDFSLTKELQLKVISNSIYNLPKRLDTNRCNKGTVFFAIWTASAIVSPIWGWILKKTQQNKLCLLGGPFLEALYFVFFGPFPGLEILDSHLGFSVFCLFLMTVTTSMSLMAAINIMLIQAE